MSLHAQLHKVCQRFEDKCESLDRFEDFIILAGYYYSVIILHPLIITLPSPMGQPEHLPPPQTGTSAWLVSNMSGHTVFCVSQEAAMSAVGWISESLTCYQIENTHS